MPQNGLEELDEPPPPHKAVAPASAVLPVCECQRTSGLHGLGRPESPELGARWVRTRATYVLLGMRCSGSRTAWDELTWRVEAS